jgi:hypothetical protein
MARIVSFLVPEPVYKRLDSASSYVVRVGEGDAGAVAAAVMECGLEWFSSLDSAKRRDVCASIKARIYQEAA